MPSYGSNDGYGRQQLGARPSTRQSAIGRAQANSSQMAALLAEQDIPRQPPGQEDEDKMQPVGGRVQAARMNNNYMDHRQEQRAKEEMAQRLRQEELAQQRERVRQEQLKQEQLRQEALRQEELRQEQVRREQAREEQMRLQALAQQAAEEEMAQQFARERVARERQQQAQRQQQQQMMAMQHVAMQPPPPAADTARRIRQQQAELAELEAHAMALAQQVQRDREMLGTSPQPPQQHPFAAAVQQQYPPSSRVTPRGAMGSSGIAAARLQRSEERVASHRARGGGL